MVLNVKCYGNSYNLSITIITQSTIIPCQKDIMRIFFLYQTKPQLVHVLRATPTVSQNRKQKPFLDAKREKRYSNNEVITGAKI